MELRQYIEVIRRRLPFIAASVLIVSVVAGLVSSARTATYRATAKLVLQPDNPVEQLNPVQQVFRDPNRYVEAQADIIRSESVATQAAKALQGVSAEEIERVLSVATSTGSDVVQVSATSSDAKRSRDIANAVAKGYIENRRENAVAGLQQAAKDLESKLQALQATISDLDARIALASGTSASPAQAEALKATREAAVSQYETLYVRQQELAVDISLQRGGAQLISEARTPTEPVSPRPARDATLGAFVGLLFSLGVAFLREHFDDRLRTVTDVERTLGLPILAELPYDQSAAMENAVATIARPQSSFGEAIRSLRTSIQYLAVDEPVRSVVITSAVPGEGKSLVSANLAAACAQSGSRTILVGADLRRPGLSRLFGVAREVAGLTNVVANISDNGKSGPREEQSDGFPDNFADAGRLGTFMKRPVQHLAFLPPGPTPPNPAELLGSQRMNEVLQTFQAQSDIVVIDTPPLLPVTDAAVLAAQADGVILVLAVNESRRDAAKRAKAILDGTGARVLGVVVNKAPRSAVPYYYAGYYEADDRPSQNGSRARRRTGALRHLIRGAT